MVKKISYYRGLWDEMIRNDSDKMDHFRDIDKAIELDYKLPENLRKQKWMREILSTVPLAVIITGKKVLATIEPTFFYQPLNDEPETIKRANAVEQNIAWQFIQMKKRGKTDFIAELVESALRYDVIATLTVPVEWQIKGQGGTLPTKYKNASLNKNGFMSTLENPKDIYARFSPLGLDMVLNAKVMRAGDAAKYYGGKLAQDIKGEDEELYVTIYDFWSYEDRVTEISKPTRHADLARPTAGGYIIRKEDMELPFMPWTVVEGGTELATAIDHGPRPLLSPLVHSEQWELMNIVQSMAFSEATAYSAAPRGIVRSHDGETIEIDYYDINKPINLKPGEDYEPIDPPRIDDNLLLIYDRIEGAFNKLTGLRALAELESPSGTAFATVNAQIKQATTALDPPKKLSERALGNIAEVMLRWTAHTKTDLVGYGYQDANMGKEFVLQPKHIDPEEIYVSARLSHYLPTDELQRINAATILMKEMGFGFVDACKKLEVPNPEEILARAEQEMLNRAAVERRIKLLDAEVDMQIRRDMLELEMGMTQPEEPPAEPGMNEESVSNARMAQFGPTRTGQPRREAQSIAARGAGFNPFLQGQSPNEVNPAGFTKEGMTGVDREGEPI